MKLIRVCLLVLVLVFNMYGDDNETIDINFKDLKIEDLIKITSRIIDKNILITHTIKGNVDFVSNKPLKKNDIQNILLYVLESKGYTIVENQDILRIVRINDGVKYNVPVFNNSPSSKQYQMITEVFKVNNVNVDYITSKIRHLISKSGKLVTDKESNTVVLSDFEDNINTVKKIIEIITKDTEKSIEIIELKNIDATLASKNLLNIAKSIYPQKVQKEKIVVLANKDNNSVMIVGKEENVAYLKQYIIDIDQKGSLVKRVVEVIRLKNVESTNVIKIIDSIIGKKKYLDENNKPFASIAEESNAIVIMGPSDEVGYIKDLIKKLDTEKLQVYVKARIIEVNDSLINDIGIKYGVFGGKVSNGGLFTFSSSLNGGNATFKTPDLSLDIPALTSGLALGASINLLKQNYAIDIVSEPSILCINNKESSIYVGETVSIKTGETTNDTGSTNSYTREDIGLTLKVKPRISTGNKVTLEINTLIEGVKTTNTASGNVDTSKKEIKTTAIVNNGESVIIGGLIEDKQEETVDKVPFLGDVPLIGELFKNNRSVGSQKNLVVIITPYIIPESKDLTYVRDQLTQLKLLEDKYLEDSLIRLKKKQIKAREEKIAREKKDIELDEDFKELNKKYEDIHQKHLNIMNGITNEY